MFHFIKILIGVSLFICTTAFPVVPRQDRLQKLNPDFTQATEKLQTLSKGLNPRKGPIFKPLTMLDPYSLSIDSEELVEMLDNLESQMEDLNAVLIHDVENSIPTE